MSTLDDRAAGRNVAADSIEDQISQAKQEIEYLRNERRDRHADIRDRLIHRLITPDLTAEEAIAKAKPFEDYILNGTQVAQIPAVPRIPTQAIFDFVTRGLESIGTKGFSSEDKGYGYMIALEEVDSFIRAYTEDPAG